jgi:hypothetical protein
MNQEVKGAAIALFSIFAFIFFITMSSRIISKTGYYSTPGVYLESDSFIDDERLIPSRT